MRRLLQLALVGVLACATTSTANAYWPYGGYLGWSNFTPYAASEAAPYYAYRPPVYYSTPVARSYGYSPYAYPGFTRTPNPMVVKARRSAPRLAPKMIVNPYYKGEAAAEEASADDQAAARVAPQVIYPAALTETH